MERYKPFISLLFSLGGAGIYGITTRLAFGYQDLASLFGTASIGFLFLVPLAIGILTVAFALPQYQTAYWYALLVPLFITSIFISLAAILTWEAWFCVVMAAPIFLTMAMLGGLVTCFVIRHRQPSTQVRTFAITFFLLAPYIFTPIEKLLPIQDSFHTADTQIEINAPAEIVWQNIIRFSHVSNNELQFGFFNLVGIPRPLEATLNYEGIGGVRRGQWEDGLAFAGTLTEWTLNKSYTLQLQADTSRLFSPTTPLHQIGGAMFDVTTDRYVIEAVDNQHVILHLITTERLTTRFNAYANLWIDFFMRDLQNYILRLVKARSEMR